MGTGVVVLAILFAVFVEVETGANGSTVLLLMANGSDDVVELVELADTGSVNALKEGAGDNCAGRCC